MSSPRSGSKASPVQDEKYPTAPAKAKELEGNDIPFDINTWVPGEVHEVKSPAEFKACALAPPPHLRVSANIRPDWISRQALEYSEERDQTGFAACVAG